MGVLIEVVMVMICGVGIAFTAVMVLLMSSVAVVVLLVTAGGVLWC